MPCPQCGRGFGNTIELCPYCSSPRAQQPPEAVRATREHSVSLYEPAGFWLRFFAYLYDAVILALVGLLFEGVTKKLESSISSLLTDSQVLPAPGTQAATITAAAIVTIVALITAIVLTLFYYPIFEASKLGATPGKILLGIKVIAASGEPVGFFRSLFRNLAKIPSWLLLGVGYLLAAFTAQKQALHDMVADCLVIRGPVAFPAQRVVAIVIAIPLTIFVGLKTETKGHHRHGFNSYRSVGHGNTGTGETRSELDSARTTDLDSESAPVPYLNRAVNAKYASQAVAIEGTVGTKVFRGTSVDFEDRMLVIKQVGGKGSLIALEIELPDMPGSGEGFVAGSGGWKDPRVTLVTYEPGDAAVKREALKLPFTLRVNFGLVSPESAAGRIDFVAQNVPARMSGSFSMGAN